MRLWDGVTRERTGRWVLGRANLDLEDVQLGRARGLRRFEMEFERFPQICQRLFFSLALAGDIQFETLGDVPVVFAPDGRGEQSLHSSRSPMRPDTALDLGAPRVLRQLQVVV